MSPSTTTAASASSSSSSPPQQETMDNGRNRLRAEREREREISPVVAAEQRSMAKRSRRMWLAPPDTSSLHSRPKPRIGGNYQVLELPSPSVARNTASSTNTVPNDQEATTAMESQAKSKGTVSSK